MDGRKRIREHLGVSAVLDRIRDAAVLEVDARESLLVVTQREVVVGQELVIALEQINVLILLLCIFDSQRRENLNCGLAGGVGREVRDTATAEDRGIWRGVTL